MGKPSIGIGDGGNELGMGKVIDLIYESCIPDAERIGCVVPTNYLIVASVSNWGGYALAAAIALVAAQVRMVCVKTRTSLWALQVNP
eukprot:23797-Eustigmatos_ZCMA.PRE.1